ncbi:hypothetical protein [Halomonas sp. I5-271120]|uniref:hypothetical protein n=1 Tax=Halomonas sp. I5-271120 TaxID=3061632 RepID=UPI002714E9D5|nr:hypothetical protein [Halomonas sp. I5-271120]
MTSRMILLTDLDDTLFTSERNLRDAGESVAAAVDRQGQPRSYQCPRQQRLWSGLSAMADVVVPVTGRNSQALERVGLFTSPEISIVSHGALVLQHGVINAVWAERLDEEIEEAHKRLKHAHSDLMLALSSGSHQDLRAQVLEDHGVPVYLTVKNNRYEAFNQVTWDLLHNVAELNGLSLHINERNAALRPPYTRKSAACAFVLDTILERQPEDTVMTFGDSLSDLPFMGAGDVAMAPTQSQIWNSMKELAQ